MSNVVLKNISQDNVSKLIASTLSIKAKGLTMMFVTGLIKDGFTLRDVAKESNSTYPSILKTVNEIIEFGIMERTKTNDDSGKFITTYTIDLK